MDMIAPHRPDPEFEAGQKAECDPAIGELGQFARRQKQPLLFRQIGSGLCGDDGQSMKNDLSVQMGL